MPEEQQSAIDLASILDNLDDFTLNSSNYKEILSVLEKERILKNADAEKLISICLNEVNGECRKYSVYSLNVLSLLVQKLKKQQTSCITNMMLSALGIITTLKTMSTFYKVDSIRLLCFEILLRYPDEILQSLAVEHPSMIYELVEEYFSNVSKTEVILQPTDLILRILDILSQNNKKKFVKDGMDIWFGSLIPTIFNNTDKIYFKIGETAMQCLELITEEILPYNYEDNAKWLNFLEYLYIPEKYPALMRKLLGDGHEHWHRLWMVCVKLLKSKITKPMYPYACPINSMLPVVETAFKTDVKNRCRAFKCWNVLIDNFATETVEVNIQKKVKLLMIPLMSNNAKVEEAALAKFNTWWHFIFKLHTKMTKFSDIALLPFLQFCFGKPAGSSKPTVIPGLFSKATKKLSVLALTHVLFHHNCNGCVYDLEKLNVKLVTTTHLVSNWKHWINALNEVVKIGAELEDKTLVKQIKCAWKSFVSTIAELPENNIRRDLVNELFAMLQQCLQDCQAEVSEIVIHYLIPAFFEEDDKIKDLFKISPDENSSIMKIFVIFNDSSNNNFYSSCDIEETIKCIRISTDYVVHISLKTSSIVIENIFRSLPASESSLMLWTAFVESIMKYDYISCLRLIYKVVLWPLNIDLHKNQEKYIKTWVTLYDYVSCNPVSSNINDEILQFFTTNKSVNTIFSVMAILSVIKKDLLKNKDKKFEKKAEVIFKLLQKQVDDFEEIQVFYPYLIECLAFMSNTKITNVSCIKCFLMITNKALQVTPNILNQDSEQNKEIESHLNTIIENVNNIIKMEDYRKLNMFILDGMKESAVQLGKINKNDIICILNTFESNDFEIKQIISSLTANDSKLKENKKETPSFTTPNNKTTSKKSAGKSVNIVNTVVENGEEFVVVKSNWKFNPKKLTDNQKEKLQRKREDIPALYQDLSQSQDEFKLTAWKTDTNDANSSSKSNSVSTTSETSTVLKDIPNTEFMPKILDNILTKNDNNLKDKTNNNNKTEITNTSYPKNVQSPATKDTKSPRMALKDRVFRNVRNLIEKSNLTKNENVCIVSVSENGSKTPNNKISNEVKESINSNGTNSAPSQLNCGRPSRVKRPPKKFVDSEIFSIKRRRTSHGQNEGQESEIISSTSETDEQIKDLKEVELVRETVDKKSEQTTELTSEINKSVLIQVEHIKEEIEHPADNNLLVSKEDKVPYCEKTTHPNENKEELPNDQESNNATTTKLGNAENDLKNKNAEKKIEVGTPKSTRKSVSKKSRIEKELAIDMVEGHPFLNAQPEKRFTRKAISNSPSTRKKATLNVESAKTSLDSQKTVNNKLKGKEIKNNLDETCSLDLAVSQDVIESSQESSITTISVRSSKNTSKKIPVVYLNSIQANKNDESSTKIDNSISNLEKDLNLKASQQDKEDSMLPQNKCVEDENNLTENMDTEPIEINDDLEIIPSAQDLDVKDATKDLSVGIITQEIANADTQPLDPNFVLDELKPSPVDVEMTENIEFTSRVPSNNSNITIHVESDNDVTTSELSSKVALTKNKDTMDFGHEDAASSPFKDEEQRKQDFLNNTLEISPIKILSPVRDEKTPSPETSNDYVVIKLCSPVQSNGEPIEKGMSPEIFTDDKISPDKRDISPPRDEVTVTHTSPLSLKKNRPQVRSGGRGAQMLGLCVPNSLQKISVPEKTMESDDIKKTNSLNTPARRNLRMLYNTTENQNEVSDDNEDNDNFLKFERNLPTTDCSPSGPILKRKLADIADEATPSPISKRKRVSFHDPPVSTTVCVKKYIEPSGVRSPQNSATKRQERQLRFQNHTPKSQRRLDKALTKTIESFIQIPSTEDCSEDTQISSLEDTPVIDVIKTSELNNTDPICPRLVDCMDPIDNIASELSSPAMKSLLVKEFEGKIATVGDLAKMTELEVNRLCIKAPKVQTAKKVLNCYVPKDEDNKETNEIVEDEVICVDTEDATKSLTIEALNDEKTEVNLLSVEMQTDALDISSNSTQTDIAECSDGSMQTDYGNMIYEQDITSYLTEKPEVIEKMDEKSFEVLTDTFIKRLPASKSAEIVDRIIEKECSSSTGEECAHKRLSFLQQYLCDKFKPKDLVLFCSELLKKVYDKS